MWEWSHTEEAYGYARERLDKLPRETLLEIAESWKDYFRNLDDSAYHESTLYPEFLTDWIWEQASSWKHGRNCSNGGHELYLDPQGMAYSRFARYA